MKNRRGVFFISVGLLLIAAALSLAGYNVYDGYRASRSAGEVMAQLGEQCTAAPEPAVQPLVVDPDEVEIPDYLLAPKMEMPVQKVDEEDYIGVLRIPVLGLELPILSEWSYPRLKISPCRYGGSAYLGDLIIAGHNYTSHFGPLKNLEAGDEVTFTDVDGNLFRYEVAFLETLEPTAVEEIESGDWALTLFTCTLDGTHRTTVRCERVDGEQGGAPAPVE